MIGRARGYHGVNIAGTSLGGVNGNRKLFGQSMMDVDHLPHTLLASNAFFAVCLSWAALYWPMSYWKLDRAARRFEHCRGVCRANGRLCRCTGAATGYLKRLRNL